MKNPEEKRTDNKENKNGAECMSSERGEAFVGYRSEIN